MKNGQKKAAFCWRIEKSTSSFHSWKKGEKTNPSPRVHVAKKGRCPSSGLCRRKRKEWATSLYYLVGGPERRGRKGA